MTIQCVEVAADGVIRVASAVAGCPLVISSSEGFMNLTASEGAVVSMSIVLVWAVGFTFRALIKTVKDSTNEEN